LLPSRAAILDRFRYSYTAARTPMPLSFVYFDLGNVLLYFDHERGCRQMAEVAGVSPDLVRKVVFDSGLEDEYEAGRISTAEFFEVFCRETGTRPDITRLTEAAGAIFDVNPGIRPVVGMLKAAGLGLGMLSNTCEVHWNYFGSGRYGFIPELFDTIVLSFQVRAMKPDKEIFRIAAERAGVDPSSIFYTDDIAGHAEAARSFGFDAVQYTSTPQLVADLHARGVRFNY
jgi:FMN phosphatase YigB (HAD superfamily)